MVSGVKFQVKSEKSKFFKRYIEPILPEILKKSLCEQLLSFLPIDHQDVIIERLASKTAIIGFENAFEEVLSSLIEEGLTETLEFFQQGLEKRCEHLPIFIQGSLATCGITSSLHHIRLEIQSSQDGFCDLKFFSSNFKDGCHRVERVPVEDLNEDFFQHFLHLESSTYWDSSTSYLENDFIEGFLKLHFSSMYYKSIKSKPPSNDFQDFTLHLLQERIESFSSEEIYYFKLHQFINYYNQVVASDPSKAREAFIHLDTLKGLSKTFLNELEKHHNSLSPEQKKAHEKAYQAKCQAIHATLMDLEGKTSKFRQ